MDPVWATPILEQRRNAFVPINSALIQSGGMALQYPESVESGGVFVAEALTAKH